MNQKVPKGRKRQKTAKK